MKHVTLIFVAGQCPTARVDHASSPVGGPSGLLPCVTHKFSRGERAAGLRVGPVLVPWSVPSSGVPGGAGQLVPWAGPPEEPPSLLSRFHWLVSATPAGWGLYPWCPARP